MEMMPTSTSSQLAALPVGGESSGLIGVGGDLAESLKGAPPDVLAAAERLSLISPMMLGAGGGGGDGGDVVRTAPGAETTDTGELSVSRVYCIKCTWSVLSDFGVLRQC